MPPPASREKTRLRWQLGALNDFAATLVGAADVDQVLSALTDTAARSVCATGAGAMVAGPTGFKAVPSPSPAVSAFQQVMERTQTGPLVDAVIQRRSVAAADVTEDHLARRWPTLATSARSESIRAVASYPIIAADRVIGALGIYDSRPRSWDPDDLAATETLVLTASGYIAHLQRVSSLRETTGQLQRALTSRIEIEQAKGIVAATFDISVEDAFHRLRKTARDHNVRLHEVCSLLANLYQRTPEPVNLPGPLLAQIVDGLIPRRKSARISPTAALPAPPMRPLVVSPPPEEDRPAMPSNAGDDLARVRSQFEMLRSRLLQTAKALVVTEDEHADLLLDLAKQATPREVERLVDEASEAQRNGDRATEIVVSLERMVPQAPQTVVLTDTEAATAE
jgi:hypothetical protein